MQSESGDHDARAARLILLLRALAARIDALNRDRQLLEAGPELLKLMGDARSELFRYEVRRTFDHDNLAHHGRIVEQAREADLDIGDGYEFLRNTDGEDLPWQD